MRLTLLNVSIMGLVACELSKFDIEQLFGMRLDLAQCIRQDRSMMNGNNKYCHNAT